jgi:hypothetical protein
MDKKRGVSKRSSTKYCRDFDGAGVRFSKVLKNKNPYLGAAFFDEHHLWIGRKVGAK